MKNISGIACTCIWSERRLFQFLFSVLTRHPNCAIDNIIPISTLIIRNTRLFELHIGVWMRFCRSGTFIKMNHLARIENSDSIQLFGGHGWNIIYQALLKCSFIISTVVNNLIYIAHCLSLFTLYLEYMQSLTFAWTNLNELKTIHKELFFGCCTGYNFNIPMVPISRFVIYSYFIKIWYRLHGNWIEIIVLCFVQGHADWAYCTFCFNCIIN
jgi:hypothetical protein